MKKLSGIKAIFFDIDDTLFPSTEFAELARRNAIRAMIEAGLDTNFDSALSRLKSIVKKHGSNYSNHLDELVASFGHKKDYKIIAAGIAAYHNTKSSIMPFPETPRTLFALRDSGFKIYAATNGNALKQWDKLIRLGLYLLFEEVFVSEEVGVEKSSSFYKKILKKLKLNPEEAVMVGDRPDKDILAAKSAGMKTIRIIKGKHAKKKSSADFEIKSLDAIINLLAHNKFGHKK